MTLEAIKRHARQHLAGRGKVTVKNAHPEAHGLIGATVILDTPEQREVYRAWADRNAVAMHKTRTEPLPTLPLLAGLHSENGSK